MNHEAAEILDYSTLAQPLSPLFLDYLAGRGQTHRFFGDAGFGLDAIDRAAERTLDLARPRQAVAAALERQQRARGAERAAERAARLAQESAVAVVTGQQPAVFGGPQFVLAKALATVELARQLEHRRGRPVVPVFWVASDDHDFAEVRQTSVIDAGGNLKPLRLAPRSEPLGAPAWAIVLDESVTVLVEELGRALPPGAARDELLARVAECYRPGETVASAFARFLSGLLPDLVVLDPADPALKRLGLPVLSRELRERSPSSRLAMEAGQALLAAGYHQQVPVRPGFLNLFKVQKSQRRALAIDGNTLELRGTGERLSLEQALLDLETDPATWSGNALLRPLVQDWLLPTAAYVGGPAEVAYHAQVGSCYAHFGIPRPVILPRPSLTLVEAQQARVLEAEGLRLSDLVQDPETLVARWARADYPDVEAAFGRARQAIEREMEAVEEALGAHDPTLRAATASARGRALHQVEGLHEKALRALKKRDQGRAERLRRTRDALFPGGSFQERGLGLVSLLGRHGIALAELLAHRLDLFAPGHQVIRL